MNSHPKPTTVRNALILLYSTLGAGVIRSVIDFQRMVERMGNSGGVGKVIFILSFTLAILWLIAFLIGKRHNWARYLFAVLFVIGVPFSIKPLVESLAATPISGLLGILQAIGQTAALVLLFMTPSAVWFKRQSKESQTSA